VLGKRREQFEAAVEQPFGLVVIVRRDHPRQPNQCRRAIRRRAPFGLEHCRA
jgi:hypothetical protein